jgi:glycine/D-amino acid oxidase-like deaminating enzyme
MNTPRQADVVIIGAGIVGTASAWFLASRGLSVIVCEKGEVGAEQSTRNWGFVRQQGRDPAELPLMIESIRIWQSLERELNADLEWIQGGNLITFATEFERERWAQWVTVANSHGIDSRVLERKELDSMLPGNRMKAIGAVLTPGDGQAEPRRVMPALRRAAEGRGVSFMTACAVFDIDVQGGAVSGVTTEHGRIAAPNVVCAAGAWSSRLLKFCGLKLPTVWLRGSVAHTTAVAPISQAATWSGAAFRQRRDGSMNVAARSADHDLMIDSILNFPRFRASFSAHKRDVRVHIGKLFFQTLAGRLSHDAFTRELMRHRILDPEPNHGALREVLAEVKRMIPGAAQAQIERSWAGYIDMTPDLLPVLDRLQQPAGLVLATGFSGHGFGLGPAVGKVVSELVADGKSSLDLHALRFARFTDGTRLRPHTVV